MSRMPRPRCVVAFLYDAPPDRPKLGYINPPTVSEKENIFYPKAPGFALGSQLHQLLGLWIVLHAILDSILNVTVGCSDGNKLGPYT